MANRSTPIRDAFGRLDAAVVQAVKSITALRDELDEAQRLNEGLVGLLQSFQAGEADPVEMSAKLERLGEENTELRRRLDEGRASAESLLAKIRFLEDQA